MTELIGMRNPVNGVNRVPESKAIDAKLCVKLKTDVWGG